MHTILSILPTHAVCPSSPLTQQILFTLLASRDVIDFRIRQQPGTLSTWCSQRVDQGNPISHTLTDLNDYMSRHVNTDCRCGFAMLKVCRVKRQMAGRVAQTCEVAFLPKLPFPEIQLYAIF